MELLLLRHSITPGNLKRQYIGATDQPLAPEGEALARRELMALYEDRDENFGNARDVRNLFEQAVARQSDRVARLEAPTREQLMALRPEDLAEPGDASSPQGAMEV